jgi:hypothetical protein
MKKNIGFLFICIICSRTHLLAQKISMSADSETTLLCKQWEMSYMLLGEQKIGMSPGAGQLFYDFKNDNTFLTYDNQGSEKTKGAWSYDQKKKIILLMVNGKHDIIISLKDGEYVQKVETAKGAQEIKIVYKARAK